MLNLDPEYRANTVIAATTAKVEAEIEGHVYKGRDGAGYGAGGLVRDDVSMYTVFGELPWWCGVVPGSSLRLAETKTSTNKRQ